MFYVFDGIFKDKDKCIDGDASQESVMVEWEPECHQAFDGNIGEDVRLL